MDLGVYEVSIPDDITPRDVLSDEVTDPKVESIADGGKWAVIEGDRILAIKDSEDEARQRAEELKGHHPPVLASGGKEMVVSFEDVLKLAASRPWLGANPVRATRMIEVYRSFKEAKKEGRPLRCDKEYLEELLSALTTPANVDRNDGYLSGAYGSIVVAQIHEKLIKPFEKEAREALKADPKKEEPKSKPKGGRGKKK